MSDPDALDERLRAVERALTDGDSDLTDLRNGAELTREVERLAARLDDAEDRLDELDAATQALRGYVGNVRAVNDSVERRADAALAKAETLETELTDDIGESRRPDGTSELRPPNDTGESRRLDRPCECETHRPIGETCRPTGETHRPAEETRRPAKTGASATESTKDPGLLARVAESLRRLP